MTPQDPQTNLQLKIFKDLSKIFRPGMPTVSLTHFVSKAHENMIYHQN